MAGMLNARARSTLIAVAAILLVSTAGALEQQAPPEEVDADFLAAAGGVLGGGAQAAARAAAVGAALAPTTAALPRNAHGRLAQREARHLLHRHLGGRRAWRVQGLELGSATPLHKLSVLAQRAPAVAKALERLDKGDRGLGLQETALLAATVERLLLADATSHLGHAYRFTNHSRKEPLGRTDLEEVLTSFLVLLGRGDSSGTVTREVHDKMMVEHRNSTEDQESMAAFLQRTISRLAAPAAADAGADAAASANYSYRESLKVAEELVQAYGEWQNEDCVAMKKDLIQLDPSRTGRVRLTAFYGHGKTSKYAFSEPRDLLRRVGALDESAPGTPSVVIANYVFGPSNCVAPLKHHSVCCISECNAIMDELEAGAGAPMMPPEQLLRLVLGLRHPSTPREMSDAAMKQLEAIAARHDGAVPLHGRLFRQWLHRAFPHECTLPPPSRRPRADMSIVTDEQVLRMPPKVEATEAVDSGEAPQPKPRARSEGFGLLVRAVAVLAMLRVAFSMGWAALSAARARRSAWDDSAEKALLSELQEGSGPDAAARSKKQGRQGCSGAASAASAAAKSPKKVKRATRPAGQEPLAVPRGACAGCDERAAAPAQPRATAAEPAEDERAAQQARPSDAAEPGEEAVATASAADEATAPTTPAVAPALDETLDEDATAVLEEVASVADPTPSKEDLERDGEPECRESAEEVDEPWQAPTCLGRVLLPFLAGDNSLSDISEEDGAGEGGDADSLSEPELSSMPEPMPDSDGEALEEEPNQELLVDAPRAPGLTLECTDGKEDIAEVEQQQQQQQQQETVASLRAPPPECPPPPPGLPSLEQAPFRPPPGLELLRPDGWAAEEAEEAAPPAPPAAGDAGLAERLLALEQALSEERAARRKLEGLLLSKEGAQ